MKSRFDYMVLHTWTHIRVSNCSFIHCYHINLRDIVLKLTFVQQTHLRRAPLYKDNCAPFQGQIHHSPLNKTILESFFYILSCNIIVLSLEHYFSSNVLPENTRSLRVVQLEHTTICQINKRLRQILSHNTVNTSKRHIKSLPLPTLTI